MGFSFHHEGGLESFLICYVTLFPAEPSTVVSLGGVIHVSPIRQLRQGSCDLSEAEVGGSRAQNPLLGLRFASELALPVSPLREFSQEVFNKHILCAWRWS